jgi:predicted DNA-binding transcriptional regulator AlpA
LPLRLISGTKIHPTDSTYEARQSRAWIFFDRNNANTTRLITSRNVTMQEAATRPFVDYIRRRKETAERLGLSVRTLDRIPVAELPRIRVSDKAIGFRESDILKFLHERTIR